MKNMYWRDAKIVLPDALEEVLICSKSKNGKQNIDKGYWSVDRWVHRGKAEVIYWMPLPDFPV